MAININNAGPPPPNGDQNLGPAINAVELAVFVPTCVIVLLRVLTRCRITYNFGWDDVLIVFAQMCNIVGASFVFTEVANGMGRHRYYLSPETYKKFLKYDYLDWAQVFVTLAASKISICLFLLRLSNFDNLRFFLKGLISFIILSHLPLFLLIVFQCNPIATVWIIAANPGYPGTCLRKRTIEKIVIAQGVFSIVTDFIGAAFPIILLWKVKLSFRTKFGLCLLMGMGVLTGIACIIRTAWSWQILSNDLSHVIIPNAIARIIEVNLGIFLACTPHMKPLFRYSAAVLSGHDPHAILLRRRRQSTSHSHWYHRLLPSSRHLSFASSRKRRASSGQPAALLPANSARRTEGAWRAPVWSEQARRSGATATGEGGVEEEDTEKSLGLPLQGIDRSTGGRSVLESAFSVPSGGWELGSGYEKGVGRAR